MASSGPGPPRYRGFTITLRHATVGRTPLEERSALRTNPHLTTQDNHKRHTSIHPAGFEPAVPESEQAQTHALDRADTGIGSNHTYELLFIN